MLTIFLHVIFDMVRDDVESSKTVVHSRTHRFLIEGSPYPNRLAKKTEHPLLCIRLFEELAQIC